MKLIHSFDFRTMKTLDRSIFNVRTGDKWFNNEEQHYTDQDDTLYLTDQGLVFEAILKDETVESARIDTEDTLYFKYGRVEISALLPSGLGTWPALWLLPQGSPYGRWPKSGEIDIVEHIGRRLNVLYFSLHTELYNWQKKEFYTYEHPGHDVTEVFHTYAIEWYEDRIMFELDGTEIVTFYKGEDGRDVSHQGWPFDQPFFLIINLAMGGNLGGKVDYQALPQKMVVESVKIYELGENDA